MAQILCLLYKRDKDDLDMMAPNTIKLEELGKNEGLGTYEKLWEAFTLSQSINIPHYFWVGLFLETISRRQEKTVELFGTLYGDVFSDWMWVEESIHSTNP